jgi:hypothetical protein
LMPRAESADPDGEEADMESESAEENEPSSESAQIWEHVKALRRRVAGFN